MQCRGAKSFVDDLGLSRGVVISRAAALLRSIETKPFDSKICPLWTDASSPDDSYCCRSPAATGLAGLRHGGVFFRNAPGAGWPTAL